MLPTSMTLVGFTLIYGASARRALLGHLAGTEAARRSLHLGGLLVLAASAVVWCRELGVAGGLITWLTAAMAIGTAVILAAPVVPRWVLATNALALGCAIVGGLRPW